MTRWLRALALLLGFAMLVAACGDAGSPASSTTTSTEAPIPDPTTPPPTTGDPSVDVLQAALDRTTSTDVTGQEITALVGGDTAFALEMFRIAGRDGGNTIISPYSILIALTMTYAGARGDTQDAMRTTLQLALLDERIHAARNELDLRVTTEPPASEDQPVPFAIRTANSLWGQRDFPFLDAFLEVLAAEYGAGLRLADFLNDPEAARIAINDWVEEQTAGRIEDLIPPGVITQDTVLVLVNAIWFKANWLHQFDPEATEPGPFTRADGSVATVPMMHGGATMPYANRRGVAALQIPYVGDASMLVLLPDDGDVATLLEGLTAAELADIRNRLSTHQVSLTMPQFEFRS